MPIEIRMPALSPTMTEGNLARWLKKEGDEVHAGDVIAEIETDKATMEYEAVDEGRLGKIIVPEGAQGIKVNAADRACCSKKARTRPRCGVGTRGRRRLEMAAQPAKLARAIAARPDPSAVDPHPHRTRPRERGSATDPPASGKVRGSGRRLAAMARAASSPARWRAAWRMHAGLDLARSAAPGRRAASSRRISSGARAAGRDGKPHVRSSRAASARGRDDRRRGACRAAAVRPVGPVFAKEQVLALAGNPPYSEKPHTAMRRVIARRLSRVEADRPAFLYVGRLRDRRIAEDPRGAQCAEVATQAIRISVNDFVIRAAALALRQVPAANASWSDDAILLWERVDIAVAVALDDGLITPIVKGADQKGLAQIAAETKDLAERARAGKLKLEEFQGGTFSISNLGMYGIREFAAVINPPHGGILAVGAGEQRPVVRDGQLAVATVMTCTLSCDHRVVDGAVGAQFLAAFKKLVEDPLTMLL